SEVCGACHTGSAGGGHYDQWLQSRHSRVTEIPAEEFEEGTALISCGVCHSGDYRVRALVQGEVVDNDDLAGVPPEAQHAVECAVCHNPHARTGNAANPEGNRDFQLRYREIANPTPEEDALAVTDVNRFGLCGQCHHDRGRTWAQTDRGPHPSNQGNVFIGEMAVPPGTPLLVLSRVSVHNFAPEQCATCHLPRSTGSELVPPVSLHRFAVEDFGRCAATGCHPSAGQAAAAKATLQTEIETRIITIEGLLNARYGSPAGWEFAREGGPADQSQFPPEVLQARFLWGYALADGSLGIHNPDYIRTMLVQAELLLRSLPPP
ncbi:MAG: hypothetical protein AB1716_22835, partial [Planctomycetota bacterium]